MNFYKKFKQNYILFFLSLAFFIGIFLRFYNLSNNPASMYWDEVAIALDAYSLKETGKDINNLSWFKVIFPSYGDYKAPVFIWLVTLSEKIFGMNPFAVRFPIAFFSSLLILISYFLVKQILSFDKDFEKKYSLLPLITSFIISINPWSVHFGRIGFESGLSVFWLALALLFFLRGIKKSGIYLVAASISACVGIYTYYSLRVIIPCLFLCLGFLFIKKLWKVKWYSLVAVVLFLALNLLVFLSSYYKNSQIYRLNNENLVHPNKIIQESSKYLERYNSNFFSKILYHRYIFWSRDFLTNYFSHFNFDFLFLKGDSNLRHHSGYGGEFLFVFLPFYLVGLIILMKNWKSLFVKIIFFITIFSPFAASMVYEIPHASRSVYLFLPLSIIIAMGVNNLLIFFNRKRLILLGLSILFFVNVGMYYFDYFVDYPKRSSKSWLYGYFQVGDWLKNNYQDYSQITIDEVYWFPKIYVYYFFPEIIEKSQILNNEINSEPKNSFELPDPFSFILNQDTSNNIETRKPVVIFLNPETKIPDGFRLEKQYYFLDGEPSLKLVVVNSN